MVYSIKIGIWKSIKNAFICVGIPGIIVLINNYQEWLPEKYTPVALPIMSVISYFIKNAIENK